jgi:hypothetical protein
MTNRFGGMEDERRARADRQRQAEEGRRVEAERIKEESRVANERLRLNRASYLERLGSQIRAALNEYACAEGIKPRVSVRDDGKAWVLALSWWGSQNITIRLGHDSFYKDTLIVDTMQSGLPWDSVVPERFQQALKADTGLEVAIDSPKSRKEHEDQLKWMEERDRNTPVY